VVQKSDSRNDDEDYDPDEVVQEADKRHTRQTFLFSATLAITEQGRQNLLRRAKKKRISKPKTDSTAPTTMDRIFELINFQTKPQIIDISSNKPKITAETLTETKILCLATEKDRYLYYFLLRYPGRTLVFVNSITCIKRLVPIFTSLRVQVFGIHAQMEQRKRLKNLERFRNSKNSILISTDVLARGVDIPAVDHVIHYQIPMTAEIYVHRSGRTARATSEGISVMFVSPQEAKAYRVISYVVGKNIDSISNFPVDMTYIHAIDKRIKAALDFNGALNKTKKNNASTSWYDTQAKLLDIEMDDTLKYEQKVKRENIVKQSKIEEFKEKLDKLLMKSIVPQGITPAYLTRIQFESLDNNQIKHDAIADFKSNPNSKLNLKFKPRKDKEVNKRKRKR